MPEAHFVNRHRLTPPFPEGLAQAQFAMGCFWGAEKKFWQLDGVYSDRRRVCRRAHAEPDLPGSLQRRGPDTPKWCSWCSIRRRSATKIC